jgi:hypothetical protein
MCDGSALLDMRHALEVGSGVNAQCQLLPSVCLGMGRLRGAGSGSGAEVCAPPGYQVVAFGSVCLEVIQPARSELGELDQVAVRVTHRSDL